MISQENSKKPKDDDKIYGLKKKLQQIEQQQLDFNEKYADFQHQIKTLQNDKNFSKWFLFIIFLSFSAFDSNLLLLLMNLFF